MAAVSQRAKITERSGTLFLICVTCSLFLMSPASTATFGYVLHALTGCWHIDTWAGHCMALGAVGNLGLNVGSRLDVPHDVVLESFRKTFLQPLNLVGPTMLFLLTESRYATNCQGDLFGCPTDFWLDLYWTILCVFMSLVLLNTVRGLLWLRTCPRNRRVADIYLRAALLGIFACALRIQSTWTDNNDCGQVLWLSAAVVPAAIGYGAVHSWRQKVRWLAGDRELL